MRKIKASRNGRYVRSSADIYGDQYEYMQRVFSAMKLAQRSAFLIDDTIGDHIKAFEHDMEHRYIFRSESDAEIFADEMNEIRNDLRTIITRLTDIIDQYATNF